MQAATMRVPTLSEAVWPVSGPWTRLAQALIFSLLTALCAQIRIALPFTPVPITGQTFAALCAGALLGSRWGALAMGLYLAEGGLGLPFFAGGAAGAAAFLGPTGGYLLGFVPGAWLVGKLAERGWDRSPWTAAGMMLLGSLVIFVFGLTWLARFEPRSELLHLGFFPFVPGDILKACLSAAALPWGWRLFDCSGNLK